MKEVREMSELKDVCSERNEPEGVEDCELRLVLREEPEGHFVLFADLGENDGVKRRRRFKALGVILPELYKNSTSKISKEAWFRQAVSNIVRKRSSMIMGYLLGVPEGEEDDNAR